MKNWAKTLVFLMLSALILTACGGKDKREPVRKSGRGGRDATPTTTDSATRVTNAKGTITTTQERLDAFVSVAGNPTEIVGLINVSGAGVSFRGSALAVGTSSGSGVIDQASIEIIVVDDLVVSQKEEPLVISSFRLHSGTVVASGQQDEVKIEFYDREYDQWLIVRGTAPHSTSGNFTGTMSFINESSGVLTYGEETLGQFSIPVCSFFKCK